MMISTSSNAIFLAGIKRASSSIETMLAPNFEIRVTETPIGKHMSYREMLRCFAWLFRHRPVNEFFVFGVMRDPVDWLLSLYNSHCGDNFAHRPLLSTRGMSMEEFTTKWRRQNAWQMQPQHQTFIGRNGKLAVNYLLDFDKLSKQLDEVASFLGIPSQKLIHHNKSPSLMTRKNVSAENMRWIQSYYANDFDIYKNLTGRFL